MKVTIIVSKCRNLIFATEPSELCCIIAITTVPYGGEDVCNFFNILLNAATSSTKTLESAKENLNIQLIKI